MKRRYPLIGCFVLLMLVLNCGAIILVPSFFGWSIGYFSPFRDNGTAFERYEDATLIVLPIQAGPFGDFGRYRTTQQAVGVIRERQEGYEFVSLADETTVILEASHPIFVSPDRTYLKVGKQEIRLSDWTLASADTKDWEAVPLEINVGANGSISRDGQRDFSIRTSRNGFPLLTSDWFISVYTFNVNRSAKELYYGRGSVQNAGWARNQQSVFIANDGRVLEVPINEGGTP